MEEQHRGGLGIAATSATRSYALEALRRWFGRGPWSLSSHPRRGVGAIPARASVPIRQIPGRRVLEWPHGSPQTPSSHAGVNPRVGTPGGACRLQRDRCRFGRPAVWSFHPARSSTPLRRRGDPQPDPGSRAWIQPRSSNGLTDGPGFPWRPSIAGRPRSPSPGAGALNRLCVHPSIVDFAERALGTRRTCGSTGPTRMPSTRA